MAVQCFYTMDGNGRKKEKRKGHPPLTCLFSTITCENSLEIRTNQFHQKNQNWIKANLKDLL